MLQIESALSFPPICVAASFMKSQKYNTRGTSIIDVIEYKQVAPASTHEWESVARVCSRNFSGENPES